MTLERTARCTLTLTARALLSFAFCASAASPAWATTEATGSETGSAGSVVHSAPSEATEAEKEQARALFREGLALLDGERYAEALQSFERAYALWENPKILLNIATAQRALGQLSRAANNYAKYQRTAAPEPSRADEVAQILATLDSGLGKVVFSNIDSHPRLWLNDLELELAGGQELRVDPGEYTLRVVQPGLPPDTRPITVWPGEVLRVDAKRPSAQPRLAAASPREESEETNQPSPLPSTSHFYVLGRADVDFARQGAVGALGAAVAVKRFLRVTGGALLGRHQGLWLGLELIPSRHWIAPVLGLSAPLFFVEGARPGGSAELGLRVEATRHLAPFARVSVAHFPNAPAGYVRTLVIPSLGLEATL